MKTRFARVPGRRRKEGWILIMLVTKKKLALALRDWLDFGSVKANGRDVDNCKTTH